MAYDLRSLEKYFLKIEMELSSSVQALLRGLAQSGDSQVTDEIVRLVFDSLVVNSDKLFTFDIRLDEKRIGIFYYY